MRGLSKGHLAATIAAHAGLLGLAVFISSWGPSTPTGATIAPWLDGAPRARVSGAGSKPPPSPSTPDGGLLGLDFVDVVITGYSSTQDQTDESPWITANATRTRPGVIALSRDLLRTYTPGAPFDFGERILVAGVGIFQVEDTMHDRWKKRADIWFPSRAKARRWGRKHKLIAHVADQHPQMLLVAEESHLNLILGFDGEPGGGTVSN